MCHNINRSKSPIHSIMYGWRWHQIIVIGSSDLVIGSPLAVTVWSTCTGSLVALPGRLVTGRLDVTIRRRFTVGSTTGTREIPEFSFWYNTPQCSHVCSASERLYHTVLAGCPGKP